MTPKKMEPANKKKVGVLIGLTAVTLLLGVAAVFTALKLKQYNTVPVAPNVPASQPQAYIDAEPVPTEPAVGLAVLSGENACVATFTVPLRVCAQSCVVDTDCGTAGGTQLKCLTRMCLNPTCTTNTTTCQCGPTATPTQTPGATATPTLPVATATPTQTPAPTATPTSIPPGECSRSCTTSDRCVDGLTCTGGRCVNPACIGETDCICPTPLPAATNTPAPASHGTMVVAPTISPPALPVSGTTLPSLGLLAMGGILLVVGLTAALIW